METVTATERTRDRRLACLVVATLFAYYLLTAGGHQYSIDGIVMFQSAKQLYFRHSLALEPPVKWGAEVFAANRFSVGFTLAYLPALALASPLFRWMPSLQATPYHPERFHDPELYGNLAYLLCAWLNPLITALTGALVFVTGRRLGLTPGWSVAAALAYGVGSPAAAYARYDFSQPLAGLWLTAAVCLLIHAARTGRLAWLLAAGAALAALLATRPDLGALIAWIGVWEAWRSRASGLRAAITRVSVLGLAAAPGLALYLWANHARFGSWSRTGYPPGLFVLTGPQRLEGVVGLLLSPGQGLLIFHPLAWLAACGFLRLIRERDPAGALGAGLVVGALLLYSSTHFWWAGWSWGPRLLVPLLPLLTLAAAFWAFRGRQADARWRVRLFAGLGALGAVIAWNGILVDPVLYHRWVENVRGLGISAAARFDVSASPLVAGWRVPPVDLLLLRMGEFAGRPGRVAAVVVVSVLLGGLAWSARRLRDELRSVSS